MNTLQSYITDNFVWRGIKSVVVPGNKSGLPLPKPCSSSHAPLVPSPSEKLLQKAFVKSGSAFIRLAGFYGATAVMMGAYGAHVLFPREDVPTELKQVFETANRFHFFHALALLGVPLTNRPAIVGSLLMLGMTIFCGSCYYYALTGNPNVRVVTPYGGTLMILGWLAMLL